MKTLLTFLLSFLVITAVSAQPDRDVPSKARDVVINDDHIVIGSQCIGFDCTNGLSFGFKTLILKENNVRLKFDDTSVSASFPRNDWCLEANSSANGGTNHFAIMDQGPSGGTSGGTPVFKIIAGAPSNSIYVDAQGDVGFGNNNPVVEMHSTDGDTPTLRLEQNGSSGWSPQSWDLAGNETNFFVRDVTNGSKLPFRIRPDAPTSSIDIGTNGVGINKTNAAHRLHVVNSSNASNQAIFADQPDPDNVFANTFAGIYLSNSDAADDNFARLNFGDGDAAATAAVGSQIENSAANSGNLSFWTRNTTGGIMQRMTIQADGQVMIGTGTADQLLSVNGEASKVGGGTWATFSDKRLKKDVSEFSDGLEQVLQINPVKFRYNGKAGIADTNKEFVGLIAQDIQEIAPYTVQSVTVDVMDLHEVNGDSDRSFEADVNSKRTENYLQFDPNALTYMLINSVKEQQTEIEDLKDEIEELKELVAQLAENSQTETLLDIGHLEQNQPNPFNAVTTIKYQLPKGTQRASIVISDATGKLIKDVDLGASDSALKGNLTLEANALPAGTYSYTLVIDGRMSDSKQMVLTK